MIIFSVEVPTAIIRQIVNINSFSVGSLRINLSTISGFPLDSSYSKTGVTESLLRKATIPITITRRLLVTTLIISTMARTNLGRIGTNCCDRPIVYDDATCSQREQQTQFCPEIPTCEDGTIAPHPLTSLFLYDKRFSLFSKYGEDPEARETISRIFWEIENFYGRTQSRQVEAKLYHVAHVLFLSEVNANATAEARQGVAAKGGQLLDVTTETLAEGTSSIDAVDSDFITTPFGRHLRGIIHSTNVGYLQLD